MSRFDDPPAKRPLLMTVDGEAKTAKTTGGKAITSALRARGLNIYEADAGAFFRLLTICVLELLGYEDLDKEVSEIPDETLYGKLPEVVSKDLAYKNREWPSLQTVLVERYVSVIGNTTLAQDAMDHWYKKILDLANSGSYDALVINARNPRSRLEKWETPVLDLLVYCDPDEAARRILTAKNNASPSKQQLAKMTADVTRRRNLDRHKAKYPYEEPRHVLEFVGSDAELAKVLVKKSWDDHSVGGNRAVLPATIKLDTTNISLENTKAIVSELALQAFELVPKFVRK